MFVVTFYREKNLARYFFRLFSATGDSLSWSPLSISLQTTLLKVDVKPYGTLNPSKCSRLSAKCFIFHTSMRSVVFIIHLAEGRASHGRRDIICIFKQFNTHKLWRPVSANTLQRFQFFLAVWRCDPGYVALLESNNGQIALQKYNKGVQGKTAGAK